MAYQPIPGGGGYEDSSFTGLIHGILQGHQAALQMQQEKRAQQEFLTNQAIKQRDMSMQDIMNQQYLQQYARPVTDMGTVTSPGASIPSDISATSQQGQQAAPTTAPPMTFPGAQTPGLPSGLQPKSQTVQAPPVAPQQQQFGAYPSVLNQPSQMPSYERKADPSRLTKPYNGRQYELLTPEEQAQRDVQRQASGLDILAQAKAKAQANAEASMRHNQLTLEGGGIPAPAGLEEIGWAPGTPMTRAELAGAIQSSQAIEKGYDVTTRPGENVYSRRPQPAAAPGAPGVSPDVTTSAQPTAGSPPLANNPTVNRMRLVASGGLPNLTGTNRAFEENFLPGYYQKKGITNPQPADRSAAYEEFKKISPEWAANEVELAQRAEAGDPHAEAALKRLSQQKLSERPVTNVNLSVPGLGPGTAAAAQPTLTGEEFMKTLPAGTAAQVRGIAEGRSPMPSASSRNHGAAYLRDAVYRFDPNYSDQRAQIRKAFTAGNDGRNIGALNTAAVHLDQLNDVAAAMSNGSFVPGNQLWNRVRSTFGSAAPTNFESLKSAVAGEMANALKGNATDPEIKAISNNLQAANSPQQLAGAIQTNLHTLGAKLQTYKERYEQQIPNDTVWSPVLPSAGSVFSKFGVSGGGAQGGGGGQAGFNVTDPRGVVHSFPTQKAADQFKQDAGIR